MTQISGLSVLSLKMNEMRLSLREKQLAGLVANDLTEVSKEKFKFWKT